MTENLHLSVIRVWAALAWADGIMARPEAIALVRLIKSATTLSDEERKVALGFLKERVELDTAGLQAMGPEAREGIYRAAARMSMVDGTLADEERVLLDRLRQGLGLSEERARALGESQA